MVVPASEMAEAVLLQPVSWQSDGTLRASIFFQYKNNPSDTIKEEAISMNFLIPDTTAPLAYDTTHQTKILLTKKNAPTQIVSVETWLNSVVITRSNISGFNNPDSFKNNHWYLIDYELDKNFGGDTASWRYSIVDYGRTGLQKGNIIIQNSWGFSGCAELRNAPNLQFRLKSHPRNCVSHIDHLTINGFPAALSTNDKQPSNISVYPNPSSNTIFFKNAASIDIKALIYSLDGKLQLEQFSRNGNNEMSLDQLGAGSYVLILRDKKDNLIFKTIIQKM